MPIPEGTGIGVPLPSSTPNIFQSLSGAIGQFLSNPVQTATQAVNQVSSFVNNVSTQIVSHYVPPSPPAPTYQYAPGAGMQLPLPGQSYDYAHPQPSIGQALPPVGYQYAPGAGVPQQYQQSFFNGGGAPITVNVTVPQPVANISLPVNLGQIIGQAIPQLANGINPDIVPTVTRLEGIVDKAISFMTGHNVDIGQSIGNVFTTSLDNIAKTFNSNLSKVEDIVKADYASTSEIVRNLGASIDNYKGLIATTMTNHTQESEDILKSVVTDLSTSIESGQAKTAEQISKYLGTSPPSELNFWDALTKLANLILTDLPMLGDITNRYIQSTIGDIGTSFGQSVSTQKEHLDNIVNKLQNGQYHSWHQVIDDFSAMGGSGTLLQGLINILIMLTLPVRVVAASGTPIAAEIEHLVYSDHRTALLDLGSVLEAYRRNLSDSETLGDNLKKIGLSDDKIKLLWDLSYRLLDISTIGRAYNRQIISKDLAVDTLSSLGYSQEDTNVLFKLYHEILPPQDLIRIADKRIWALQTQPKFGQYTEKPDELVKFLKMYGYDEDSINWLWAAHWSLPSPQAMYELQHRNQLEPGDIETFLGLTDMLPYFRDKLFNISYNVLTRVDVRRLYKQGVIDDARLHRAHLDMGYNEQDARLLDRYTKETQLPEDETEITALERRVKTAIEGAYTANRITRDECKQFLQNLGDSAPQSERIVTLLDLEQSITQNTQRTTDLRKGAISAVLNAYKRGNIPRSDARANLIAFGYDPNQADQQLGLLEIENAIRIKGLYQDTTQKLYAGHMIEALEFRQRLTAQGFSDGEIQQALTEAVAMRDAKTKKLSVAQLQKLLKKGTITAEQYRIELAGLGYQSQYIDWLMEEDVASTAG